MEDIIIVCVARCRGSPGRGDGVEIKLCFSSDLTSDDDQIAFGVGLAGDTAGRGPAPGRRSSTASEDGYRKLCPGWPSPTDSEEKM